MSFFPLSVRSDFLTEASYLDVERSNSDLEWEQFEHSRLSRGTRIAPTLVRSAVTVSLVGALVSACIVIPQPANHPSHTSQLLRAVELDNLPAVNGSNASSLLMPSENRHDGNVCDTTEELYGGLCYKRCSVLTYGKAPIRTSSWTCCENHPCFFGNQHGSLGSRLLCTGYDVDGEGGCPHKPGVCLLNEEMHLGICYMKCDLLTDGQFPYRVAAATCCKVDGLGCLDIRNDRTRREFDVGGGASRSGLSTPAGVHPPEESLTESGDLMATTTMTTTSDASTALATEADLEPAEHLYDGNVCDDTEELYAGLCYKKCIVLTSGEAPIRTSSWTCCRAHPCGLWNQLGSIGHTLVCNGYDVSGSGGCPHKPGACLVDEELHLGVCYKKCSILTNSAFPYRVAAATCCKQHGLGCLDPRMVLTSRELDVGGGGNTPEAHLPDESLTEVSNIEAQEVPSSGSIFAGFSAHNVTEGHSQQALHESLPHVAAVGQDEHPGAPVDVLTVPATHSVHDVRTNPAPAVNYSVPSLSIPTDPARDAAVAAAFGSHTPHQSVQAESMQKQVEVAVRHRVGTATFQRKSPAHRAPAEATTAPHREGSATAPAEAMLEAPAANRGGAGNLAEEEAAQLAAIRGVLRK